MGYRLIQPAVYNTKTFGSAIRQAALIALRAEEGLHSFHKGRDDGLAFSMNGTSNY